MSGDQHTEMGELDQTVIGDHHIDGLTGQPAADVIGMVGTHQPEPQCPVSTETSHTTPWDAYDGGPGGSDRVQAQQAKNPCGARVFRW